MSVFHIAEFWYCVSILPSTFAEFALLLNIETMFIYLKVKFVLILFFRFVLNSIWGRGTENIS